MAPAPRPRSLVQVDGGRRAYALTCNIQFKHRLYSLQVCLLQEKLQLGRPGLQTDFFLFIKKHAYRYRGAYSCIFLIYLHLSGGCLRVQTHMVGTRRSSAMLPCWDPASCRAETKPTEHPALPSNYVHQRRFYFYRFTNKPVISAMTGCCCWLFLDDQLALCRMV